VAIIDSLELQEKYLEMSTHPYILFSEHLRLVVPPVTQPSGQKGNYSSKR
jgi:hypothetical protein